MRCGREGEDDARGEKGGKTYTLDDLTGEFFALLEIRGCDVLRRLEVRCCALPNRKRREGRGG